jgi:hypothetical protein
MEPASDRPGDIDGRITWPVGQFAAMEPASDRPGDRQPVGYRALVRRAAMEPASDRPGDQQVTKLGSDYLKIAAMEPASDRPGDGSRNSSRLSCANGEPCEQSPFR